MLNVGLEGMMLAGAYGGFIVALDDGLDLARAGRGHARRRGVVSLLMVLLCVRMQLDQIVIGIGIMLVAEGAHEPAVRRALRRVAAAARRRVRVVGPAA